MEHLFYILHSEKMDKFYIGHTSNVSERLKSHLHNHRGLTSRAKDWLLVYIEMFPTKEEVYQRELKVKKWKSKLMIRKLIESKQG